MKLLVSKIEIHYLILNAFCCNIGMEHLGLFGTDRTGSPKTLRLICKLIGNWRCMFRSNLNGAVLFVPKHSDRSSLKCFIPMIHATVQRVVRNHLVLYLWVDPCELKIHLVMTLCCLLSISISQDFLNCSSLHFQFSSLG